MAPSHNNRNSLRHAIVSQDLLKAKPLPILLQAPVWLPFLTSIQEHQTGNHSRSVTLVSSGLCADSFVKSLGHIQKSRQCQNLMYSNKGVVNKLHTGWLNPGGVYKLLSLYYMSRSSLWKSYWADPGVLWKKAPRAMRAMRVRALETVPFQPYFGCTKSFLEVLSN